MEHWETWEGILALPDSAGALCGCYGCRRISTGREMEGQAEWQSKAGGQHPDNQSRRLESSAVGPLWADLGLISVEGGGGQGQETHRPCIGHGLGGHSGERLWHSHRCFSSSATGFSVRLRVCC